MLKLYDSLKKEVLEFRPACDEEYRIYACGPTVYKDITIGNLRTFSVTDLLQRYLEYKGYKVKLVMNITDVGHALHDADTGEDKVEKAAREEGLKPEEIARKYEKLFFRDIEAMGIRKAWKYPRATEEIGPMIALTERLIEKGKAYVTDKGDVYYDVSSFGDYGKLSGNSVEELVAGARVEVAEDKRHPADFALWIRNPNHVMQWNSPWGMGYPGWHLECSAMALKYLGETFDLHIGGEDLKFPHHECEIAQAEGATGKTFARQWLHVKYLFVEGEKMSKSKGNFYTLSDLLDKGYSATAVRYLLLSAQYRQPLNFTLEGLGDAERIVRQFAELKHRLLDVNGEGEDKEAYFEDLRARFDAAMDDDLNVSEALAVLHELKREMNRLMDGNALASADAYRARELLIELAEDVLGLTLHLPRRGPLPNEIRELAEQRRFAREEKDWAESDRLRDEIEKLGWTVRDSADGQEFDKR